MRATGQSDNSSLVTGQRMHRRDLLQFSIHRVLIGGLAIASSDLLCQEAISWGAAVSELRLGLRLQRNGRNRLALAFLNNVGNVPQGVFVSLGLAKRLDFLATSPGGHRYRITQRAEYAPCAGLCHWPVIDNLNAGQILRIEFAMNDLIYVSEHDPIEELQTLLSRRYSVQASFAVTDEDLSEALNQDMVKTSWRGRITSPRLSLP
jgi:hypothetical protein